MNFLRILVLSTVVAAALAACNKPQPPMSAPTTTPSPVQQPAPPPPATAGVTVTAIDLGNAVDADNRITAPSRTFTPKDTIYAAVSTNASAPSATIAAKWTYQDGQTVNESSQSIAPTGPAVTTFHIAKPDGWPAGGYTVTITIDGKAAGTASFDVK